MFDDLEFKLKIGAVIFFVVGVASSIILGILFTVEVGAVGLVYMLIGVFVSWLTSVVLFAIAKILATVYQQSFKTYTAIKEVCSLSAKIEKVDKKIDIL